MPVVPGKNPSVEESAKRLGMTKKMLDIQQYPMPETQASDTAAGNIVPGNSAPADPDAIRAPSTNQSYTSPLPPQNAPGSLLPQPAAPANEYESLLSSEETNPYDQLLDGDRSAEKKQIQASMFAGTAQDPDRAARVRALSRETNLPEDLVDRNFDTLARKMKVEGTDYDSLIEYSPALAEWLAEPKNAAVAHDDLAGLSYLERQVRHIKQEFQSGKRTTELADIGWEELTGNASPEQVKRGDELEAEMGQAKDYGITSFGERIPGYVANQLPIFGKTLKGSLAGAGAGFVGGAAVGATGAAIAGQLGPQVAVPEEVVTVPAAALATGTTGAFWVYRAASGVQAGKMEAALAYRDLKKVTDENGVPIERSTMIGASLAVGAVNGALELVGLESVLKAAPGFQAFKRGAVKKALLNPTTRAAMLKFAKAVGESAATEGVTEAMQSLVTNFSKVAAKAYQDKTLPKWDTAKVLEALNEAWEEGKAGAGGGGGMTIATGGASLALDLREVKKSEQAKEAYQALGEAAAATKLAARDGEALGKLVAGAAGQDDVQSVYMPVEAATAYFQGKGIEMAQVASELGVDQEYQEARATGGDIKVPLAKFVEKVVGTEHWKGLENDVKFDPDGLTPNEVAEIRKDVEARAKALDEESAARAEGESQDAAAPAKTQAQEGAGRIFQAIQEQLKAAGLSQAEQAADPKLIESFFTTLGETLQMDPETLFSKFPLQIQKFNSLDERNFLARMDRPAEELAMMKEVSQGARTERLALARKALEAIPDVSADAVAEAFGLKPLEVRRMSWKGRAKGKGVETNYSREQILEAAGVAAEYASGFKSFNQSASVAPAFYSRLTKTVEEKMGGSATRQQIDGMLKEIKPEERKWLGLDEFLEGKEKVSKAELLEHLRANALEVKEVVKDDRVEAAQEFTPEEIDAHIARFNEALDPYVERQRNGELAGNLDLAKEAVKNGDLTQEDVAKMEAINRVRFRQGERNMAPTKFSQYTLPGGENYREVLFTLPGKSRIEDSDYYVKEIEYDDGSKRYFAVTPNSTSAAFKTREEAQKELDARPRFEDKADIEAQAFRSSHFDEANVIAHTRLNDRVDADGKRVLFVEEIQSDWHQAGRKKGYKGEAKPEVVGHRVVFEWAEDGKKGQLAPTYKTVEEAQAALERAQKTRGEDAKGWTISDVLAKPDESNAVPDAPFRKTWHEFVMKRIIRMAAEQGYDRVAWTTGEQQAERYDLSKQVDSIKASRSRDGGDLYDITIIKDGSTVGQQFGLSPDKLEEFIGKDLAAKIQGQTGSKAKTYKGVDLKVGGEGMKGFYDKILVDFANKFGKKFGAKVEQATIETDSGKSYDPERYSIDELEEDGETTYSVFDDHAEGESLMDSFDTLEEAEDRQHELQQEYRAEWKQREAKVHSLDITPALKKSALEEGFSLFQGEKDDPRGQITFGGRRFNIDLFKKKDRSTFLHETGHFFLEVMGELVEGEGKGSERIQKDYAAILDFFGVKSREDITEAHHEKFARAFETYLSEGKAPSLALRDAFASFRKWLTRLWKRIKMDKVEVSPELREVFDRMLATEEEIAAARKAMNMAEELGLEGLDSATQKQLEELQERARARAEEELLRDKLKETTEKYKADLEDTRKKFREAAEIQVGEEPLFQAIRGLKELAKDPYKLAEKALAGKLKPEQSAEFELLADEFGFTTVEEMARQVVEARDQNLFEEKVGALVTEGLRQGGMIKDATTLREEALRAIHSDQMAELLALEREALIELSTERETRAEARRRNRAVAREEARAAAEEAARILALKPASEAARPQLYITMERNAAARAARFIAKKEYEKAAQAKKEQLVAHAMVRESFRINEEYDRHVKYVTQFTNRKGDLLQMPYGFVRQVDALLARYGFQEARPEDTKVNQDIAARMEAEGKDGNEIANATGLILTESGKWVPETLADFIDRQNENYHALQPADSVFSLQTTDPKTLNIEELREFREAVEMLVVGGRKHDRFLSEFIKIDAKQAAMEIRASIEKNVGKPRAGDFTIEAGEDQGFMAKVKAVLNLPDAVIPSMVNVETLSRFLDRGDENGPVRRMIYRLMSQSEDRKQVMLEKAIKDMNAIMAKHYTPAELAAYKTEKRFAIQGLSFALTKEQILSMALNWGNQTNRERVMMGYNISQESVQDAFAALDKRDWDFAQEVWDYLDSYWPDIKRIEMKVKGIEPTKVQATKVVTKFGVYKGGYYPIAYDFNKNAEAHKMNEQRSELYKQYSAAAAHTERGHAESRVSRVKRPVRLSLGVMFDHLENVIHDISYRESVIDVNRLLRESDVKQAIQNAVGLKGYLTFDKWLQDIASDQRQSMESGEQFLRWFRLKATMSTLGFRAITVPMDLTGNIINVMHEIGPSRMARAIGNHVFGQGETNAFVEEKSAYMRSRGKTMDRDLSDLNRRWQGRENAFQNFAFFFQRFSDDAIAKPLWKEVYAQSVGKYSEEEAIQIANEAVKRTMGSGSSIDLVGAQRGGEFKKILTMYYSWASMMFNRAWLEGKIAGLEYNEGNYLKAVAVAARGAFFLWALHAVNENLWREFMRNSDKEDDDEKVKRIVGRTLSQPFGYVWLGRDIAGGLVNWATGQRGNIRLSPVEQAAETIFKPIGKGIYFAFSDPGKFDQRYFEESTRALSLILGTPQSLNNLAFNFIDWVNNEGEATWRDALSRRSKK